MQVSHDREKAWGNAFKAWNSENLAAVYEGEHMLFAGLIGHGRSRGKPPLSGADILHFVHPEKGCTVEPDFLFSKPLCAGSLENVVNVLILLFQKKVKCSNDFDSVLCLSKIAFQGNHHLFIAITNLTQRCKLSLSRFRSIH